MFGGVYHEIDDDFQCGDWFEFIPSNSDHGKCVNKLGEEEEYNIAKNVVTIKDMFETKYIIYKKYIFEADGLMEGVIPAGERFQVCVYNDNKKIVFDLDGTFQIFFARATMNGTYKRKDELVYLSYSDSNIHDIFLIYKGRLTDTILVNDEIEEVGDINSISKKEMDEILHLHKLEQIITQGFSDFEDRIREEWRRLPNLNARTIYNMCPYFEGKETYFQRGIRNVINAVVRADNIHSEDVKNYLNKYMNKWFSGWGYNHWGSGDYELALDEFFDLYTETFEAITANSEQRIREAKEALSPKINCQYGFITNDFSTVLLYETTKAIFDTLNEVSRDNKAWDSVLVPQMQMHTKLSQIWQNDFEKAFMKKVLSLHKEISEGMMNEIMFVYKIERNYYVSALQTNEFKGAIEEEKRTALEEKNKKKKDLLRPLEKEYAELDLVILECGKSILGEKARRKKVAIARKKEIEQEIFTITNPKPIPKLPQRFICYDLRKSDLYDESDKWRIEYDESERGYILFSPMREKVFKLNDSFTKTYGKHRIIGATIENWVHHYNPQNKLEISLLMFDLDE